MTDSITVYSVVEYMPVGKLPLGPSQEQWGVHHFCKLLKEGSARNSVDLTFFPGGREFRRNEHIASIQWSGRTLARLMRNAADYPITLIPFPSSSTVVESGRDFLSARIADQMALEDKNYSVWPNLRFKVARPSSRQSGKRNVAEIKKDLILRPGKIPSSALLIDDVFTTGAHLRAAASFLHENGCDVIAAGVMLRTVKESPNGYPQTYFSTTLKYY